jgi:hypothetical protein
MRKNGQYVFNRRFGGSRVLGGIFGGEKTLFFSQKSEESSVFPCRQLVAVLIRNIDFSCNDLLYNEIIYHRDYEIYVYQIYYFIVNKFVGDIGAPA